MRIAAREQRHDMPPLRAITNFQLYLVQFPLHPDRQEFPTVFVQYVQCSERPAIIRAMMHKIVRPNMITILGTLPDT